MNYPKYQKSFMPESYFGYCSTACFMGILNYFRYTQFNMKDTWDVIKIAKLGSYSYGDMLDEKEMAYCLDKLGFNISIYSGLCENEFMNYLNNPLEIIKKNTPEKYIKFIKGNFWEDGTINPSRIDLLDTKVYRKIVEEKRIPIYFQNDIVETIKNNQSENTLFILGVNRYKLFQEQEIEGESGGHVVLCKGIKDGMFEIYDPGPNSKPEFINQDIVVQSMIEMGPYIFIMVKNGE